jgi:hypothetical protein
MANVKISQLTAKGSKIATTDRVAIAQDDGGGTFSSKYVTGEQLFGYKKYTALLSQTGTNAPTATVLENSLGGTVVWTRNTDGEYYGTLLNAFPINKTFIMINAFSNNTSDSAAALWNTVSQVAVLTCDTSFTRVDNILSLTSIEIRVYP